MTARCRAWRKAHPARARFAAEMALVALALLVHAFTLLRSSQTYDERGHLNASVVYWKHGDALLDPNNPPLRSVLALPAMVRGMPEPLYADAFLTTPEQQVGLYLTRFSMLGLFLAWAWVFGRLTGRWFGGGAGLCALALVLFAPTFSSHSFVFATDVLVSMLAFLVCAAAFEWTRRPSVPLAIGAGALAGLALTAKFSALLWCAGVVAGVVAARLAVARTERRIARDGVHFAVGMVAALVAVGAVYRFDGLFRSPASLELLALRLPSWMRLPLPGAWLTGLDNLLVSNDRPAYFHGTMNGSGTFLPYFPLLLAMKPPLALIGLWLLGLSALVSRFRRIRPEWLVFAVPAVLYFVWAVAFSRIQIGVRHLFPLFPVLLMGAAATTTAWKTGAARIASAVLAVVTVVAGLAAVPHQMASFNVLAGGPENAWRWYSDSSLDWGQGWDHIARWLDREGIEATFEPVEGETTGWIAVNPNTMIGFTPGAFARNAWLRELVAEHEDVRFVAPHWHVLHLPEDHWTTGANR